MKGYYRIGDLAELCGVSSRTIDYYTRMGLLSPTHLSEGRHRLYDETALATVRQIKAMQAQRFSLAEIRDLLRQATEGYKAVFPKLRRIEEELVRLDQELAALRPQLADASMPSEARLALLQRVGAAAAYALALASHLSSLAAESGVRLP